MDNVFTDGVDAGAFLIKAQLKVDTTEFASPILQGVVEKLSQKYEALIDKVLEDVESDLMRAKAEKALRLVVFDGGAGESDLFKAGKPTTGDGYTKVKAPGSKGGKFWVDPKGNVRYDERPDGPSPKHKEATDEEVEEHIKSKVTPTLFVGHSDETMDAILKSGKFSEGDIGFVEWFRSILGHENVLGTLDGIHDLEDVDARNFVSESGAKGGKALQEWMDSYWYDKETGIFDPDMYDNKKDIPTQEEAREWFEDLINKYNEASKDPAVKEALKADFIRLQKLAESVEVDVTKMAPVSAGLGEAIISPTNIQDGALVGLTLMKGMNLVYIPTSGKQLARGEGGKVNKRKPWPKILCE